MNYPSLKAADLPRLPGRLLRFAFAVLLTATLTIPTLGQESATTDDTVRELMMYRIFYTMQQDGEQYVFLYEDPWPGDQPPFSGLFEGSTGAAKAVYQNAGREDGAAEQPG